MKRGDSATKVERKIVEKNRRKRMKCLSLQLSSLIPNDYATTSKDAFVSQQGHHLEQAATYIKNLRERIERLKQKKKKKIAMGERTRDQKDEENLETDAVDTELAGMQQPVVEVRHQNSILEVVLITGMNRSFFLSEVVGVLEEEGAEVVNASFSVLGDSIFYTIHSQAIISRIGVEASRISERLKQLIQ